MAVLDERGRLFGRINLIDAGIALLVIAMIVVLAVGYSVFKVPAPPEVNWIEPASQPAQLEGEPPLRVIIHGKNFLPFMRAVVQRTGDSERAVREASQNPRAPVERYALVSSTDARFFVESPSVAEVWLPNLKGPGTYDLVLFNESQQVAVKEAAFTLTPRPLARAPAPPPPPPTPPPPPPPPLATIRVYGEFTRVNRADVSRIAPGARFTSTVRGESGEVLSVGAAESDTPLGLAMVDGAQRVPVILRVRCSFMGTECRVGPTPLIRQANIGLLAGDRPYQFHVSELIVESSPMATVRASGVFTRLDRGESAAIAAGAKFTSPVAGESGEVLSVGTAEPNLERIGTGQTVVPALVEGKVQVPAMLRIRCSFTGSDCRIWTTPLVPGASIKLMAGSREYAFTITSLAADATEHRREARVAARFVLRPEMDALIRPGDVDLPGGPDWPRMESARVSAVGPRRESTSETSFSSGNAGEGFRVQEPVVLRDVTLSVPVTEVSGAWSYKGQPIRPGGGLLFETARYVVRGYILSVTLDREATSANADAPPK